MNGRIGVLPVGRVPEAACRAVAGHVERFFGLAVEVLPPLGEPSYALDRERMQYNAAKILAALEGMPPTGHVKILALLNVDLYIPVFTHVFGEAREGGGHALVSMFRLGEPADGAKIRQDLILGRLVKVVLHEAAHLFDLVHCMEPECLMHFSMNTEALDRLSLDFCPSCAERLRAAVARFF